MKCYTNYQLPQIFFIRINKIGEQAKNKVEETVKECTYVSLGLN